MARLTEGNASRLANEISQTMQTLVGGHMTAQTGQWLLSHHLIKGLVKQGGGKVTATGLTQNDLLQTEPVEWANKVLLPAIESTGALSEKNVQARMKMLRADAIKAGETPNDEVLRERAEHGLIAAEVSKSGMRTTVTDQITHAIANEMLINREVAAMKAADGAAATAALIGQNPLAAMAEFTNSTSNLMSVLGSPAAAKAGVILDELAHGVASLGDAAANLAKKHPDLVADVGLGTGAAAAGGVASLMGLSVWKTLKWLTGFGGGRLAAGAEAGRTAPSTAAAAADTGWLATLGKLGTFLLGGVAAPASMLIGEASGNEALRARMKLAHPDWSDEQMQAWVKSVQTGGAVGGQALSAPTGAIVPVGQRAPWPTQIQDMERSIRAEQDFRRDPEAAHGRAYHALPQLAGGSQKVDVAGAAKVDQTFHFDISLDPEIRVSLDRLKQINFDVNLAGSADTGRMDSDAAPQRHSGIGKM
jgi:hypothetical protein